MAEVSDNKQLLFYIKLNLKEEYTIRVSGKHLNSEHNILCHILLCKTSFSGSFTSYIP